MSPQALPQGMSEADYETIESAVTETVRGRWFLGEFARRSRTAEMRQLLDAMSRVEDAVAANAPGQLPADPSVRLLMQRVREVSARLETISAEMRDAGVDQYFSDAVDNQARAVAGMMRAPGRGALPSKEEPAAPSAPVLAQADLDTQARSPQPRAIQARPAGARPPLPASLTRPLTGTSTADMRLAALSALDSLTLSQKLAFFS